MRGANFALEGGVRMRSEAWFVYRRSAGRFRAMPVSWQGWAVLVGGIVATMLVGMAALRATAPWPFALRLVAHFLVVTTGVLSIYWVAYRKGRPSD